VPNETEHERLAKLLSPGDASETRDEDHDLISRDLASLVRLIASQPDDETVLSELIRRAVPASSD
jgi:hypothetical protein